MIGLRAGKLPISSDRRKRPSFKHVPASSGDRAHTADNAAQPSELSKNNIEAQAVLRDGLARKLDLETVFHAAVDRQILGRLGAIGRRLTILLCSVVFGGPVQQLQAEIHFGQSAELA